MRRFPLDSAGRVTWTYVILGGLWLFAAERGVVRYTQNVRTLTRLDTYSGWILVAITAPMLYFERRRSDRRSRRLYAIVSASDDAILGGTPAGVLTSWNRAAERLYGYKSQEALGRTLHLLFPRNEHDAVGPILKRIQGGESIRYHETLHVRRDGTTAWLSLTISPIHDAGQKVIGFSATARDITHRKQTEDALRVQAQIIDQIHDAVVSTDLEGYITSWNRGAGKLFGYTAEEMLGGHVRRLYPDDQHGFLQDEVIAPLKGKGEHEVEVRMRRQSGEEFYASISLSLLRNDQGVPTGMIGYSMDITERKRAEKAMRMAEVGKLASGLVHEVRNPLNAMRMQIAVIRNKLKRPDADNLRLTITQLERLEHEVLRVERLASDFLTYGRPGSEKSENVDLYCVAADVVEFIKPEFEQTGVRVKLEGHGGPGQLVVRVDRDKLRQVLLNLAENARQAMAEGGHFTLRCERTSDHEVRITASDTGCGIPEQRIPLAFEAFYSTKDEGSGLGLPIVKETVEAAGGRVRVESEVGRGTSFEIYLPLADGGAVGSVTRGMESEERSST